MTGKTVVPEEAVEAAARSLYQGQPIYDEEAGVITGYKPWEWMEPEYQVAMLEEARAALEAAAPFIAADAKREALEDAAEATNRNDEHGLNTHEEVERRGYLQRHNRMSVTRWLRARAAAVRGEG